MFSHAEQALQSLTAALAAADAAPTSALRQTLKLTRALRARLDTLETTAASLIADRERHGDGGAAMLNQVAGRTRKDAARNARTAADLEKLPAAQAAVAQGEISLDNAALLTEAARKTSAAAVEADSALVEMAKTLPADELAQATQRWSISHQSRDELAEQHRRNRRNRYVRVWNGANGTVEMRGAFDAETGARISARLRAEAERMRRADRRRLRYSAQPAGGVADGVAGGVAGGVTGGVRTADQRMADALDRLLAVGAAGSGQVDGSGADAETDPTSAPVGAAASAAGSDEVASRRAGAEIIVRADLAALLGDPNALAEITGTGPIPASALERLCCNSNVSIVLFGDELTPLYETCAARAPTAAQRRALIARDGACIGCGAPPGECEAHHIHPFSREGKTRLDNLVLLCWSCHDRVHDHNWQVVIRGDRYRLLAPSPQSPPNPAPSRKPDRANRTGRADHRGDSTGRADRGNGTGRADRGDSTGRADRGDSTGRADRGNGTGRADRGNGTGRADRGNGTGRADRGNGTGRADRGDSTGRSGGARAAASDAGRAARTRQTKRTGRAGGDRSAASDSAQSLELVPP